MPDILPEGDDPTPTPQPRPEPSWPRSIVCDGCGCTLARDGAVMKMGERAKKLVRVEDRFDRLETELAETKVRLETANARVHELEIEMQRPDREAQDVGEF